jgi:formylglycine-generating enzyme required for sulfatase activity
LLNYNLRFDGPQQVGSFPGGASPYGALDMAGNLWEWVSDYYGEVYYSEAPNRNPSGPTSGEGRSFRGGSWASEQQIELVYLMTMYRFWNFPSVRSDVLGFRCALDAPAAGNDQGGDT